MLLWARVPVPEADGAKSPVHLPLWAERQAVQLATTAAVDVSEPITAGRNQTRLTLSASLARVVSPESQLSAQRGNDRNSKLKSAVLRCIQKSLICSTLSFFPGILPVLNGNVLQLCGLRVVCFNTFAA